MKNYTKEEIAQIVSESSKFVLEKNMQSYTDNAINAVKGKSDTDAIITMFAVLYSEAQKNCEETIIEVLNKILND